MDAVAWTGQLAVPRLNCNFPISLQSVNCQAYCACVHKLKWTTRERASVFHLDQGSTIALARSASYVFIPILFLIDLKIFSKQKQYAV
jgi:hypothetical protein